MLRLLSEHGAAGVTMEAVAAAAGTSKAVLYRGVACGDVRAHVPLDIARELGQSVLVPFMAPR